MGLARWSVMAVICALEFHGLAAQGATRQEVQADVEWSGPCEARAQLESELQQRGIKFIPAQNVATSPPTLGLSVMVREQAPTEVSRTSDAAGGGIVAELQLSDAAGRHEARVVEVAHCGVLHSTLALILASFAEGPNRPHEAAQTPESNVPRNELPLARLSRRRQPPEKTTLSLTRFEVRPKHGTRTTFGELWFSTHATSGVGWVDSPALGTALQLEWHPLQNLPWALAASFAYLPTRNRDDENAQLRRWFGRLTATVNSPIKPLKMSLGAECGRAWTSAPSLADDRPGHATWVALTAMPRLELPLLKELQLQLATGVAVTPIRYALKYSDTDRTLQHTGHFEWRAELGLAVRLSPSFP